MKKIFKKSFAVIFLMTLMLLVPIQSLAETKMGETFYFDGQDELYQQFLKERHYPDDIMERYEMWLQANDYFGKDEKDYDPNLVSMDLAKPIWRTSGWTKELIAEFFDTEDKVNFLHQYKEQNKVNYEIYVPLYYDGKFTSYANKYIYNASIKEYADASNFLCNEAADYILVDRMLKTLEEYGLGEWTPQHTFMIDGFVFVLCEKDNQTVAAYFPDEYAIHYCEEFNERFLKQKILTKEELVSAIAEYEDKYFVKPENQANQPTVGGGATEFEEDVSRVPWLWIGIVGGAVALVALILVFALKKKKV